MPFLPSNRANLTAILTGAVVVFVVVLLVSWHLRGVALDKAKNELATERAAHAATRGSVALALTKIDQQNADAKRLADERDTALRKAQESAEKARQANAGNLALASRLEREARPVATGAPCKPSAAYLEARGRL